MINMIPYPSGNVRKLPGNFIIPGSLGVEFGKFDSWCVDAFAVRIRQKIFGTPWVYLEKDESIPEEGYVLTVDTEKTVIKASTELGVVWALTTFVALIDGGKVPCCSIEDAPKHIHRALSLDCARHFFPVDEVMKIIEEISLAKMNVLHWHLSDDQAWRIESKKFPKLHITSQNYYTQDEIREIVKYARIRGVEIIPEIDMPGHTTGILAAYPEYSCSRKEVKLAASGGIYPVILCAGREDTFDFVEKLLEEIIPLFPGKRFHIGGDEAPKSEWKRCPYCQKKMKELGITAIEDLQGYFTTRVIEILKKHGKQPICWNETLLASNVPKGIQVQYWTLQHRIPMQQFVEHGGKWIYSDMFEIYLDYPYSMSSLKKVYGTVPHLGRKNVADDPNLLGLEGCLWTEHIEKAERLENLLCPRIYALAELNWCGRREYSEFKSRLKTFISSGLHRKMCYTPEDWWEPKGRLRREEAIDYFIKVNSMPSDVKAQTMDAAAPNREFAKSFMSKFFRPMDIPALLKAMIKK